MALTSPSFSSREGGGLFLMPALGGPARKVLAAPASLLPGTGFWSAPQWSRDGSQIAAAFRVAEDTMVMRFSFATQQIRTATFPGRCLDMSWSPDGQYFACAEGQPTWDVSRLWIMPAGGGDRVFLAGYDSKHTSPSWSPDGRFLFFVSNRGGSMDVWRQRIEDGRAAGDPQRWTTALGALRARFSPRSDRLAYSRGQTIGNIWKVPILRNRIATWADAVAITSEQARVIHLDLSPDGQRLVFSSTRSGSPDLWMTSSSGGEMKRLTVDSGEERGPQFSSDGTQIAFHSTRNGSRDIWIMPAEGGPGRVVAAHAATDRFPTWSPDDKEIAFISDRMNHGTDIWVVPSAGGEPRELTDHPGQDEWPLYTPDGQSIVFVSTRTGVPRLYQVPRTGGAAEPFTEGSGGIAAWAPDGLTLYFRGGGEREKSIWALATSPRREFQVADLSARHGTMDVSSLATDGRYLYFTWAENQSDIWVMDVVKRD